MFKKLISNLPFNPSLLGQVNFYAKRLRQEESIRRAGFGFMALAMFVQMFAVLTPPQKSLAYSSDYIINGLRTRDDILNAWDGKTTDQDVAKIYQRFGLTRADIEALPLNPNVTIASNQQDFWTTGRTSLSAVSKSGQIKQIYKDSEQTINYGSGRVYLRQLKAWDIINPVNYYKAFQGTKNGEKYWILVDCGNFTRVGNPPEKTPAIDLRKTIDDGPRALKPGDKYSFSFEYRNTVEGSPAAKNVVLKDTLDLEHFDVVSPNGLNISKKGVLTYNIGTVAYTDNYQKALTLTVRLKKEIPNGQKVCNAAELTSSNAGSSTSGGNNLCIKVLNPCPLDDKIPSQTDERCTKPVLVCTITTTAFNRTTKEATLTTKVDSSNPVLTHITDYNYDFGDKNTKKVTSTALKDVVKHTYKDGKYTYTVRVNYYIGDDKKTTKSVDCTGELETKPDQPLTPTKLAQNITQKLNNDKTKITKANPKDVIEYTLNTKNTFNYDRANYTVSDNISDILDYADLDKAYLKTQKGTFNENTKTITWANQTVKAHKTLSLKFRVIVKDPIPATNQPGTMTTAFDCVISNKYGTEVAIPINCPPVKTAEYVNDTLPNTGPGTSAAIGAVMVVVIGYFFARSRLLNKELELIKVDYSTGGAY